MSLNKRHNECRRKTLARLEPTKSNITLDLVNNLLINRPAGGMIYSHLHFKNPFGLYYFCYLYYYLYYKYNTFKPNVKPRYDFF